PHPTPPHSHPPPPPPPYRKQSRARAHALSSSRLPSLATGGDARADYGIAGVERAAEIGGGVVGFVPRFERDALDGPLIIFVLRLTHHGRPQCRPPVLPLNRPPLAAGLHGGAAQAWRPARSPVQVQRSSPSAHCHA